MVSDSSLWCCTGSYKTHWFAAVSVISCVLCCTMQACRCLTCSVSRFNSFHVLHGNHFFVRRISYFPIRLSCEESIVGSRHAIALHHYCPSSPPSSLTHVGMTNKDQRGPRLYQVAPVPLKRIKSAADFKYTWDGLGIYDEEDLNEVRHHFRVLF